MTQKELLYLEDAIGHEKIMINKIEEGINLLEDEELKEYMQDELTNHEDMKQAIFELLEGKANE